MDSTGADLHGFDPFPGSLRFPGRDAMPGPLAAWTPSAINVNDAHDYANQRFLGARDKSLLALLAQNKIGARV